MAASETQTRSRTPVRVLSVAIGGCGACAASVRALLAPRYAARLAEQGISFTETPRHADVVLITGALPRRERDAALAYVDGVPQPRVLVAAGNCAINGCVFAGSPDLDGSAAEALNVHVEIGGCPPQPDALLAAIAQAAQLLADVDGAAGEDDGASAGEKADDEEGRDA